MEQIKAAVIGEAASPEVLLVEECAVWGKNLAGYRSGISAALALPAMDEVAAKLLACQTHTICRYLQKLANGALVEIEVLVIV